MLENKNLGILKKYPDFQATIGIEVHVQLNTKSKIFCGAENGFSEEPNTNIDPICVGLPGSLPVLNQEIIKKAIQAGLGTNCIINHESEFSRKHYFYPDLPKNYQITQAERPICTEGYVTILDEEGKEKKIRLIRIHIEEDAGKNIHGEDGKGHMNYNRAGSPLLEIVSYPDIESSFQARAYLKELHAIVTTLNITTGNMELGAFRADSNVSVKKKTDTQLGTRCELKNINSFKFISDAIEYELERQVLMIMQGEKVVQQTRLWDTKNRCTYSMRDKEDAADYRYFPDPDLPLLIITPEEIELIKKNLPELPYNKRLRLSKEYNLNTEQALVLSEDHPLCAYFETAFKIYPSPILINWIMRELASYLKESKKEINELLFTPEKMAELVELLDKKQITNKTAQDIFTICIEKNHAPKEYVIKHNLQSKSYSEGELTSIIKQIIDANPKEHTEYKNGRDKLFGFFVGKAMAETKGQADPAIINALVKKLL